MPDFWSLDEYESGVGQEEHEGVVEHHFIEESLSGEEKVGDVRYEETEGRQAEHDGIEDAEHGNFLPRQTDVHHPGPPPVLRVGRSEAELSSDQPDLASLLVPPLRQNELCRGPGSLQRDLVVTEMVRK